MSRIRRNIVTGQLCLIELVAWGALYYGFAVFLPQMQADLGWSVATLSAGFSVALIVSGLAAPFVGRWIDRRGSRGLMVAGAIVGSLGVVLWSLAYTMPVYFAAWALIGTGMAGTLYAPAFATVVRSNPDASRNAILVITLIGALASTVFLPLGGALSEWLGWRSALGVLAALFSGVTIPLCATLPNTAGVPSERKTTTDTGRTVRGPASFRRIVIAMMLADAAGLAFNAHLVVFLVDRGQPLQAAAGIAALLGIAKLGGRLATWVGGSLSALALMRASLFLTAAALLFPLVWPSTSAVVAMVVLVGASTGARTIVRAALVVEMFGASQFGAKDGLLHLFTTLARAAGPVGMGVLLGLVGGHWSWAFLALLMVTSGAVMFGVRPSSTLAANPTVAAERV